MQKTTNVLLMLTSEERENAQVFIRRRLKTLDTEQLDELQALSQMSKQFVRRWQLEKGQYTRSSSRAAKLMVKLHDAALADIQGLIKEIDQVAYELNNKVQHQRKENGEETDPGQKAGELLITCEEEELQHAVEYIQEKTENLKAPDLKIFRDACQEVLSWWQSERGQVESLHFDQLGDINTASGRLAIRQRRDKLQTAILNPLRNFFRDINTTYQRVAKEAADEARAKETRAKNTV